MKKILIIISATISTILLITSTIALVNRNINGTLTGITRTTNLIINQIGEQKQENIALALNKNKNKPIIKPGDKGNFVLKINTSKSKVDVKLTIEILKENLPDNLKFYVNDQYEREFTNLNLILEQTKEKNKQVTIYWCWEEDNSSVGEPISININISAEGIKPVYLYETIEKETKPLTQVDDNYAGLVTLTNQNSANKIMIYKGNVKNNNVIYAGYCWLIVRTTETRGIKLVYNGTINEDGSCTDYTINENYETGPFIAYSPYNEKAKSPVYVGYMYNDDVNYVTDVFKSIEYQEHLNDNTIDNVTGKHNQNKYDSTVKSIIDEWYKKNINKTASEKLLEDTVWCNDRKLATNFYPIEYYEENDNVFGYIKYDDLYFAEKIETQLTCSKDVDKFTVESRNGNGDLTYPIGLLTADEIAYAGVLANSTYHQTYLSYLTDNYVYTMSPMAFGINGGNASMYALYQSWLMHNSVNEKSSGVRPAISLSNETKIISGNGSFEKPFVID